MFMNIRRRFLKWLRASDNEFEPSVIRPGFQSIYNLIGGAATKAHQKNSAISVDNSLDAKGFSLRIMPGEGGIAITASYYDNRRDEHISSLFIIPDTEDLAQSLAHIITLQSLKDMS